MIDANLAVWAVLPVWSPIDAVDLFTGWRQRRLRVLAPTLWLAESVSAIPMVVHRRAITADLGEEAIEHLLALEVETVPIGHHHCRSAYLWATRLGQVRAYDGFYLALAEELGADFWTADRRLANAARHAGVAWVRAVGDPHQHPLTG